MPLPYTETDPLEIPAALFNDNALAVIGIQGARYDSNWHVSALVPAGSVSGGIVTSHPEAQTLAAEERYSHLGHESAYIWLNDQAKKRGWRVLQWKKIEYGPDERAYFFAAEVVMGSEHFVPAPGAQYADDLTLDQALLG